MCNDSLLELAVNCDDASLVFDVLAKFDGFTVFDEPNWLRTYSTSIHV